MPEGQAVGTLTVSATPDANFGTVVLKVIGTGQGPAGPIVEAATKSIVYAQQGTLPTSSEDQVGLAAAPAARPTGRGPRPPAEPIEAVHGYGAPIPLKVTRGEKGEGVLNLAALPASAGLAVPAGKIEAKATEGNATVNVDVAAPLVPTSIALTAKGNLGGKEYTLAVPEVTLQVVRPAALELAAPMIEVKQGATVEVKGKVVRKGPFKEPVKLTLNGLPAGLKAEPVTVPPEAAEFTIKVVADAGAAEAMAGANVAMAFQVNKKDYATPATPLAVKVVK